MQRDFKGIWIPREVWLDNGITTAVHLSAAHYKAPGFDAPGVLYNLRRKGLIIDGANSPEKVKEYLCSKDLDGHGLGDAICEWCKISTLTLHEHHYPIEQSDGGTQTVRVCPTCHQEFHTLRTRLNFQVRPDLAEAMI